MRNVSGIYSIPPGTEGVPDTTIESNKYNTFAHDVETDLNTPRPVVAGGTGANNADGALVNLSGEKSSQKVDNYDSFLFQPGSFYSDITATGSPIDGHAFVGVVISSDIPAIPPANQNVVIHARDQTGVTVVPGQLWVRQKVAGVWGAWSHDATGTTSSTPPVNPPDGALWWSTVDGQLYVYYRDVDTAQWVAASAGKV
jgi:hypothetical protein